MLGTYAASLHYHLSVMVITAVQASTYADVKAEKYPVL
jgi:hypothetical protein